MQSERVLIFDTTLRDGEQAAGTSLNPKEKLEIAKQLERLGVDIIEAGFPITSEGDFEAVRLISREVRKLILRNAPSSEIQQLAEKEGMKTLRQSGINLALLGETTIEQVIAATTEI